MFILFVKFSRPYIYSLPYVYYGLQSINIYFVLNIFLNLTFSPFSIHDYNDRPQGGLVIIVQIKTNMKNKQMAQKKRKIRTSIDRYATEKRTFWSESLVFLHRNFPMFPVDQTQIAECTFNLVSSSCNFRVKVHVF